MNGLGTDPADFLEVLGGLENGTLVRLPCRLGCKYTMVYDGSSDTRSDAWQNSQLPPGRGIGIQGVAQRREIRTVSPPEPP